jgi:hypothetical protein
LRGAEPGEGAGRNEGTGPGAQVLTGKLRADGLLDVGVEVAGPYVVYPARIVEVLEDLVAGEIPALLLHPPEPRVGDGLALLLPLLAHVRSLSLSSRPSPRVPLISSTPLGRTVTPRPSI